MPLTRLPQAQTERLTRLMRVLLLFTVGGILALCALAGGLILHMRETAWSQAARSAETLLRSVERTLDRDIELYDLSLRSVVEGLQNPILESASPEMRQLGLFDRAATAKGFGSIFVLDPHGQAFIDSDSVIPRRLNASERAYFQIHRSREDVGLFIGQPMTSAVSGKIVIPLSRRLAFADGTFAGVVIGTLHVEYFTKIFERLNVEPGSAINLIHANGTLIVRTPAGTSAPGRDLSGDPSIQHFIREETGHHTARSAVDGVERLHAFTRVGHWPLQVTVARDASMIDADWRLKAIVLGLILLTMCAAMSVLSLWLRGELHRRMEAEEIAVAANQELMRLAATDSLTGLANRRRFDEALTDAHRALGSQPVALLLLDTDHFKRYNDIYGHAAGDQVLKAVARILHRHVPDKGDLACRIGGEEFAVILKGRDADSAAAVAESIRQAVADRAIPHAGHEHGMVTVSIGVMHRAEVTGEAPEEWFALADAALYEAKRQGRNQVRMAGAAESAESMVRSVVGSRSRKLASR
jgi:diguanylate cyclase (GGDEF)-like protein